MNNIQEIVSDLFPQMPVHEAAAGGADPQACEFHPVLEWSRGLLLNEEDWAITFEDSKIEIARARMCLLPRIREWNFGAD